MKPKTRTREERVVTVDDLEVRAAEGADPLRIIGHPVVYNRWSEDLGGFRERVLPGAATKTIKEADIRVLLNHDPNYVLGRNKAGTAEFTEDAKGVRMVDYPPDTATIRDLVITPMERKDIDQMSFAFRTVKDEWREPTKVGGLWERDVAEFQMFDASIVTFPAYTSTDVGIRDALGIIDIGGLDLRALTALLTRAERGITLTDADIDLITGSIEVLRLYLPTAPVADVPDVADDHAAAPDAARRTIAHLRRLQLQAEAAA